MVQPLRTIKQRYTIVRQVGQGGFGSVYQARDGSAQQQVVAIKEMGLAHLPESEREETMNRILREALILASLTHEHIPKIYDHFIEQDSLYLVMEYIWGHTLEHDMNEGRTTQALQLNGTRRFPLDEVLPIALQICSVLEYLHARHPPVVFRDLKPSNIMRTASGHLYLIDFGIARLFRPGKLKDTLALGSPGYAAPEQYGRAQTTPKADVYSFGAVLHALVSGHDPCTQPFQFQRISDLVPDVPRRLSELVEEMLEMDMQKRPPILEIHQELLRIQRSIVTGADHSFSAAQPASSPQGLLDLQRLGWRGGGRAWSQPCRVQAIAWSPDNRIVATGGDDGLVRLWDIIGHLRDMYPCQKEGVLALDWSPSGIRFAAGGITPSGVDERITVWKVATGTRGDCQTITGHTGDVLVIAWSPDGSRIASGSLDRTCCVWEGSSGASVSMKEYPSREGGIPVSRLVWSPDGTRIAAPLRKANTMLGGEHALIDVWEVGTANTLAVYTDHTDQIVDLVWSPDGTRIASASKGAKYVLVWDPSTGTTLATCHGGGQGKRRLCWLTINHLASLERNGEVIIWDVAAGLTLTVLRAFATTSGVAAWSRDGNHLAAVGLDEHTFQVWTRTP